MSKVGVKEISEATGFSPATVSKALNGKAGVNAQTSKAIRDVARELGYAPSSQGGALLFVLARKSGRILDDSTFHPAVIDGVESQAREFGLTTSFMTVSLEDKGAAEREIGEALVDPMTPAVVLATELDEDELALFSPFSDRIVLLDNSSEERKFDSVVIANRVSAKAAVKYLASHGHREIGYLSCDFRIHNFRSREKGYLEGLAEEGLAYNAGWRASLGTTLDEAYGDMVDWLASKKPEDLPSAFFADSDLIAVSAMRALIEYGVKIPEDISLFGFDDGQLSLFSVPPLTTMHVMRKEMGSIAVRRAVGKIRRAKDYACTTQVETDLIERASVSKKR